MGFFLRTSEDKVIRNASWKIADSNNNNPFCTSRETTHLGHKRHLQLAMQKLVKVHTGKESMLLTERMCAGTKKKGQNKELLATQRTRTNPTLMSSPSRGPPPKRVLGSLSSKPAIRSCNKRKATDKGGLLTSVQAGKTVLNPCRLLFCQLRRQSYMCLLAHGAGELHFLGQDQVEQSFIIARLERQLASDHLIGHHTQAPPARRGKAKELFRR